MSDLGELQKKQTEAASFALRMAEEKDPERLKAMAEQLQARCAELGKMAKALEAALAPAGRVGAGKRGLVPPRPRNHNPRPRAAAGRGWSSRASGDPAL